MDRAIQGSMVMKPRLDRWIQYGNCLVGYAYDYPPFANGTRIITEFLRYPVDIRNFEAEDKDTKYKLGTPGTFEEHMYDLIGKPKDSADKIEIKEGWSLHEN